MISSRRAHVAGEAVERAPATVEDCCAVTEPSQRRVIKRGMCCVSRRSEGEGGRGRGDTTSQGDLMARTLALRSGRHPAFRIAAPDPLFSCDLPGSVHRSQRGAQMVDAGEDGESLFGRVRCSVRQRVADRAGVGERHQRRSEDLCEHGAGFAARLDLGEVGGHGGEDIR